MWVLQAFFFNDYAATKATGVAGKLSFEFEKLSFEILDLSFEILDLSFEIRSHSFDILHRLHLSDLNGNFGSIFPYIGKNTLSVKRCEKLKR